MVKYKKTIFLVILFFILLALISAEDVCLLNYTLSEERAVKYSNEIIESELKIQEAESTYLLSYRSFLPSVSLSFTDSSSITVLGEDSKNYNLALNVKQLIYDGGLAISTQIKTYYGIEIEKKNIEASKQTLRQQIRSFCVKIVSAKERLKIQLDSLESAKKQYEITMLEYQKGYIVETVLLETKLELEQIELALKLEETALLDLEFELKAALHINSEIQIDIDEKLPSLYEYNLFEYNLIDYSLVENVLIEKALSSNLEIEKIKLQIIQMQAEYERSKLWFIPKVAFEGGFNASGSSFPLGNPSLNAKFTFSFAEQYLPSTLNSQAGLGPGKVRTYGSSSSVSLPDNLSAFTQPIFIRFSIENAIKKQADIIEKFRFSIKKLLSKYILDSKSYKLKKGMLLIQEKKMLIFEKRLALGEITRLEYIKESLKTRDGKLELVNTIQTLKEAEWQMESMAGLESGSLYKLVFRGDK